MSAAYIIAERGKLTKESKHLVFHRYDGTENIIQLHKIDSIMIIGNVSLSGEALQIISDAEMPVVIAESNGMFRCVIEYQTSKNVFLHQKQFRIYEDEQTKLNIAKSIVKGKVRNQMSFVQRINRKGNKPDEKELDGIIKNLKKFYALSEYAKSIEQLRGYEGGAAKYYFPAIEKNLKPKWAVFHKRSRNPPKSNVNAVLSFLYMLLGQRIYNAIRLEGLHPMVGTLHEMSYGRDGLVYDLMEEFRIPICDVVCCNLINHNILNENDFRKMTFSDDEKLDTGENVISGEVPDTSSDGIYLNTDGVEKVIEQFEEKLAGEVMYGQTKKKMSMESIIVEQVKMYKRVLSGEEKEDVPFVMR